MSALLVSHYIEVLTIFQGHVDHGKTTLTAAITKHLAKKPDYFQGLS
jgi:translation elongation factor EF-Tu-like GTPase